VMTDRGLVVLRFRNEQVFVELKRVLDEILRVAEERTAAYPPTPSLNREGESG
jgi:very-short-patch-repair endonuclease